jgi:hypothetical protein
MSYVFSNEIKYSDSVNLDAFGRLRTSSLTTLLDIKHLYDKLPRQVDEVYSGTGTSSWKNATVTMQTSNNNDFVIRQTIKSAPYQSGKSQLFEASFRSFHVESSITKRVGYFTSDIDSPYNSGFDGFFLESDGSTGISFQIWQDGSNILTTNTSSWLKTEYDVDLMDWSLTQLIFVDFQWLGVGRLRFYMVIDGIPRLFYEHIGMNNLADVYMNNSNKPIRYEIRQNKVGVTGVFRMICSGVSMEGSVNSLFHPLGITDFTERTLPLADTTYAVLGIRLGPSASYIGASGFLQQYDVLQTSNDNYLVTVQKGPSLSGTPTWNSISNTPIQYSFGAAGVTVSTDGYVLSSMMGKAGSLTQEKSELGDNVFSFGYKINGTPEEWWICIKATSVNCKVRVGANIKYFK